MGWWSEGTLLWRLAAGLLLTFASYATQLRAQTPSYYLETAGGEVVPGIGIDAELIHAKEWQVRLYKRGEAAVGRGNWGLITGPSAAAVTQTLTVWRRDEDWARRASPGYNPVLTVYNSLGPIAIMDARPPIRSVDLQSVRKKFKELNELHEMWASVSEIRNSKPRDEDPFKGLGRTLLEYDKALQDAFRRLAELKAQLSVGSASAQDVAEALRQVDADLTTAKASWPPIAEVIARTPKAVLQSEGKDGEELGPITSLGQRDGVSLAWWTSSTRSGLQICASDSGCQSTMRYSLVLGARTPEDTAMRLKAAHVRVLTSGCAELGEVTFDLKFAGGTQSEAKNYSMCDTEPAIRKVISVEWVR